MIEELSMRSVILTACLLTACAAAEPPPPSPGLPPVRVANELPHSMCQPPFPQGSSCPMERCQNVPIGCASEEDNDCDGVDDFGIPNYDNCITYCNPGQENADGDLMGDVCDLCPNDPGDDIDNDGVCGDVDNCPAYPNANQTNADADAFGDACDQMPNTPNPEAAIAADEDRPAGWPDVNCNGISRPAEGTCTGLAANLIGLVTVCSTLLADDVPCDSYVDTTGGANTEAVCNASIAHDLDMDGWGAACDNCDDVYNPSQADADLDGIGDACE